MLLRPRHLALALTIVAAGALSVAGPLSSRSAATVSAGFSNQLPNGTYITPVGSEVAVLKDAAGTCTACFGLLPEQIAVSPDGKYLATSEAGTTTKSLTIVEVATHRVVQHVDLNQPAFGGIVWLNSGTIYTSGGTYNSVYILTGWPTKFALSGQMIPTGYFPTSLALDPTRTFLYAANLFSNNLTVINTTTNTPVATVPTGDHPYGIEVTATHLYVSNWGGATVTQYLLANGVPVPTGVSANPGGTTTLSGIVPVSTNVGTVARVGDHPTAMTYDSATKRLYVTNGNDDTVSVVDPATMLELAHVRVSPEFGRPAPNSAAPGALAISGHWLFVALGGDNAIAVVDTARAVADPLHALAGFIPTGWYPSALAVLNGELFYANGKGDGPSAGSAGGTGVLFQGRGVPPLGSMWYLPVANVTRPSNLASSTATVTRDNNWSALPGNVYAAGTPLMNIRHVIYILRENKTFDEEFSDLHGANGQMCQTPGQKATFDATMLAYRCPDGKTPLLQYGREITPNNHFMASNYALLNNFHVDVETSIIGHQYANASQLSDFAQRTYGNTSQWTKQEPGFFPQNGAFDIANPSGGYLVDAVLGAGRSARLYSGGYDGTGVSARPQNVAKILDNTDLLVPIGLDSGLYPDTLREREFERDVNAHGLADFSYLWLSNDHTVGGLPANLTPQSQVATNDLATGQLLSYISHSPYWADTAVFIQEDDPQGGQDHISGYRSIFMLASPWAKRGYISNKRYDMSSVLRTIEVIFGTRPLSQNDLEVSAMTDLFTNTPDYTAIKVLTPAVPPTLNPPTGVYADWSKQFDLTQVDPQDWTGFAKLVQTMNTVGDRGWWHMKPSYGTSYAQQWAALGDAGLDYASLFNAPGSPGQGG